MNPWVQVVALGGVTLWVLIILIAEHHVRNRPHRVAEGEGWVRVRRLGSTRGTQALIELGQLAIVPCSRCGHDRLHHLGEAGGCQYGEGEGEIESQPAFVWQTEGWVEGERGFALESVEIAGSIESACWCPGYKRTGNWRRIP